MEAVVGMYYIRRKKDNHQKIDFCVLTLNSFLLIEFALQQYPTSIQHILFLFLLLTIAWILRSMN